jgi:hypothetical protein
MVPGPFHFILISLFWFISNSKINSVKGIISRLQTFNWSTRKDTRDMISCFAWSGIALLSWCDRANGLCIVHIILHLMADGLALYDVELVNSRKQSFYSIHCVLILRLCAPRKIKTHKNYSFLKKRHIHKKNAAKFFRVTQ